ncbi:MAG: Na(+)-translocating NADH-quinone reductase subunit E [Verrucomicrobia bacterium]|nr:Na(+)-translocating NADH-quinone reductase subunit E [Verrucomicrobiota bacterium]
MSSFLVIALVVLGIFAACVSAMAVGLFLRGRSMRGGCGGSPVTVDGIEKCDSCDSRKMGKCKPDLRSAGKTS